MVEILVFRIDQFSFWIGFVAGILFAWVLSRAIRFLPVVLKAIGAWIRITRENFTTGSENRIRQDVLNWAQRQHLAAPLFSLDEILIQPRLLAPAQYVITEDSYEQLDIASRTVPYMPDWPEMAAAYGAPTLTPVEALQGGSDLIIIGQPGIGKTIVLASLASQMARRDPVVGELAKLFPLLVPAAALLNQPLNQEPFDAVLSAISNCYVSPVIRPRLKSVLRFLFQNNRALFMLDGLDELSQKSSRELLDFVTELKKQYPHMRMVVTARVDDFSGFNRLGFVPLAVAGWTEKDKLQFIQSWHQRWNQFIEPDALTSVNFVDTLLLEKWLLLKDVNYSPFDITLKTWGTFSGDLLGPRQVDLIDAHIRRMTVEFSNARGMLQAIAVEMVNQLSPVLQQHEAENAANRSGKAVVATPPRIEINPEPDDTELHVGEEAVAPVVAPAGEPVVKSTVGPRPVSAGHLVSSLLNYGLLTSYGGSYISFIHPYLMGYLAGNAMLEAARQPDFFNQPDWTGKEITLSFWGATEDISDQVITLLEKDRQSPIRRDLFKIARWLRIAPQKSPWRPLVMRNLFSLLQNDSDTISLAGRAVCAMVLSEDPAVGNLLRTLLKSNQSQLRQLAALGLGMLGEARFVTDLASLTQDISPVVGRAVCLGLVGIGNKSALDNVITILLHGTEDMRRAAAEALVNKPQEGVNLLKEGLTMDDIIVRRAVIYGILRTKDPELSGLIEKTAIEDAQWVVRDAAAHALEQWQMPNTYIPTPYEPLTQQAWLINFAGKSGVGVRDSKHGHELVLQAIENGDNDEKMKALEFLRQYPHENALPRLYGLFYSSQDEVREATFDVLWHTSSAGINLPPPQQFGLG